MNHPHKSTRAVVALRVEEVLRIRLDGAEFHDVREYAVEQQAKAGSPWELPQGRKPLSDATLWRYTAAADELIRAGLLSSRKRRLRLHLARRANLFAKAVNSGDLRTALAVLDSSAKLEGLYPTTDGLLASELANLQARLDAIRNGPNAGPAGGEEG